jgi:RNA polymerase sigma factor (sigma-70 family)
LSAHFHGPFSFTLSFGKTGIYPIFKKMLRLIDSSQHLLEKEVWTRVGSGDQDAYGQLYVFYYRRLYNYGRKMTADIALLEDALQETLVSVWTGRERLHMVQKPHSYLLQTFRWILFRKLRRDRKVLSLENVEPAEPDFGREEILIRGDIQADLEATTRAGPADPDQPPAGSHISSVFMRDYHTRKWPGSWASRSKPPIRSCRGPSYSLKRPYPCLS